MKMRILGAFAVVALMLTANLALAGNFTEDGGMGKFNHDSEDKNGRVEIMGNGRAEGQVRGGLMGSFHRLFSGKDKPTDGPKRPIMENAFMATGEIKSISSSSLVIHTTGAEDTDVHRRMGLMNVDQDQDVTIKTSSDTKIMVNGDEQDLSDLKVGYRVMVAGTKDGDTLTATRIHVLADKKVVYGEVTDVDSDSVTIKNNETGNSETVSIDSDTKVVINGEVQSASDIEEGDKGVIRIKSFLGEVWGKVIHLFR